MSITSPTLGVGLLMVSCQTFVSTLAVAKALLTFFTF